MKLLYKLFISFILILSYQYSNICYGQNNSIVLDGAYIVLDGGTAANNIYVVVDQPNPSGIVRLPAGGHIHSESQYHVVKWLSASSTGNYVFPFGIGGTAADYIPFTFNKTAGNSSVNTSTWSTNIQNSPHPTATNVGAVTSMSGITDSVLYAIDRFWDIQATTTTADLTFSYKGTENTTAYPNSLVKAQHWNGNAWDAPVGTGTAGVTTGIGTAGPFAGQNTFSPWALIVPCTPVTFTQNPTICQGANVTVGTSTYATTGVFVDTLMNSLGCDSIVTTNLTVNPLATGTDTQIACGSFTWINGTTYTTNNSTATFTIVGGSATGCDSIVTLNLTIQNIPNVIASANSSICEGQAINLMATTIAGASYQWTGPNGFTSSNQNPSINTSGISNGGIYQVIATIGTGCADTAQVSITINPLPTLTSSVVSDSCGSGTGQITVTVNSPNPPFTYSWNNGSTTPSITDLSQGGYQVTVTDNTNCSVTNSYTIFNNIDACNCFVYVANAFSPNGDNNNDFIPVRGDCVKFLSFKIFNRWGNLVFETDKLNDGWNGYYKDELQNTGVYVYFLEATLENGKTVKESGDISLIR
ncbi:MAG: gliding motility-associated C-terminal domain-containing protein [Crocinitomicaceae bacterium]|nr:gliding motility-associated C-terminal domain-containing protein [Crocinitomicaceae bacterium]